MNNEPKPGMGFLPTAGSKGRAEIIPNPAPAPVPVVNNYYFNFSIPPEAVKVLKDGLFWAVMIVIVLAFMRYGSKLA